MRRVVAGSLIAAVVLAVLGLVLATQTAPTAGQPLVRGRVTSADGQPAAGVKVWLNALPAGTLPRELRSSHRGVPVTVVGSAITTAKGSYAIRITSPAALAPNATDGEVHFMLMTGDSVGWSQAGFSARVVPGLAGPGLVLSSDGSEIADLRLTRNPVS